MPSLRGCLPLVCLWVIAGCSDDGSTGSEVVGSTGQGQSSGQGSASLTGDQTGQGSESGSSGAGQGQSSTGPSGSASGGTTDTGSSGGAVTLQLHLTAGASAAQMQSWATSMVAQLPAAMPRPSGPLELQNLAPVAAPPTSCSEPSTPIGQAGAEQLESLRYYIANITLCESLETTGSAYSNPQGCISLYDAPTQMDYQSFRAQEARDNPDLYIDLLDPASLATLNQPVTLGADAARQYNFGLINWYRPVMVRATVDLTAGGGTPTTLYTQDGELIYGDAMGGAGDINSVTDLTVGPAADAVAMLNNGGTWFRFQQPFEITQDDVDGGVAYTLDLVFNPADIIVGMNCTTRSPALQDDAGHGIFVPMLELSPVPRRADQTAWRETYVVHVQDGSLSNPFDMRIELYSLVDDPTATIYGVGLAGIITASTSSEPLVQKVSFVQTGADETIEFQDYAQSPMLSGFSRLANVGDMGTLGVMCNNTLPALSEQGCAGGERLDSTYELISAGPL